MMYYPTKCLEVLWKPQQISVKIVGVLAKIEAGTSRKQIVGITA